MEDGELKVIEQRACLSFTCVFFPRYTETMGPNQYRHEQDMNIFFPLERLPESSTGVKVSIQTGIPQKVSHKHEDLKLRPDVY